jgi:hypothetical protein
VPMATRGTKQRRYLNCAADGHHGCQLEETGNSVRRRFLAALWTSQCSPKYTTYAKYWCVGDKEQ